ncbi:MAG: hypothetical protein V2I36_11100 [Desulfopila sp.]|jgi:hypothetical protein|nr:hypothetical protein [Desulfopila sp.]
MKNLVLLYVLLWIVPTLIFAWLPIPENAGSVQRSLISFFFIALYILLAANLAYRTIVVIINSGTGILYHCAAAVVVIFGVLYVFSGIWGKSQILSAFLTAILLFGAAAAGAVLSTAVKRIGELLPLCLTAATADLMSVLRGPTRVMADDIVAYYEGGMEGTPPFIDYVIIKAGIPGFSIPVPLFGVTDWILVALLSASLFRLNTSENIFSGGAAMGKHVFLPVSACSLYAAIVIAQITGVFIPAMLFISFFFLLFLFSHFKLYRELRKSDLFYSIVFPGSVALLVLLFAG